MTGYSLILRTTASFLLPLLLVFSVFLLLRGHNLPGGGFIGGLVASSAFVVYLFAFDSGSARELLRVDPRTLVGVGLMAAGLSGVPAVFLGQAFFTGQWLMLDLPVIGELKLSTPLVFDIGVYLVVLGSVMAIVISLAEAGDHD